MTRMTRMTRDQLPSSGPNQPSTSTVTLTSTPTPTSTSTSTSASISVQFSSSTFDDTNDTDDTDDTNDTNDTDDTAAVSETDAQNNKPGKLGAIIGGAVGGAVVAAGICGVLIFILTKRRKLKKNRELKNSQNFPMDLISVERQTFLSDIVVQEKLGGGKFGEVYRGLWQGTTSVALKKLRADDMCQDFDRECQFLQSFAHKNIVQFLGVFSENSDRYMVTEYLKFGALDSLLKSETPESLDVNQLLHM
eukprot:TRINITY_DN1494_c0_g1_i1.p2 TRINITY_DN1494_c0_g1~~TRINITY_DN1494_c0_g1_i1.p2  ORF type:complete len:249 (-),score=102.74 TRINITY_DN1494_c0_g1_i1:279-1025(-)